MKWGTWIVDYVCSTNWLNDEGFFREDLNQEYFSDAKEISEIPLVRLFDDLATIGYFIDWRVQSFWFRPWLTSPLGMRRFELSDLGEKDYLGGRKKPRYPKNSDYMGGWKIKNPETFTQSYHWEFLGFTDCEDGKVQKFPNNPDYVRGWNEAKVCYEQEN